MAAFVLCSCWPVHAATEDLPKPLHLKDRPSPFTLRMALGYSPMFCLEPGERISAQMRVFGHDSVCFWDNQWHMDYDTSAPPNYVNEARFAAALPRFGRFCKNLSRTGCNAIVVGDLIHLVTFDKLAPGDPYAIYPKDDIYRRRHVFYRDYFRKLARIAAKHDMTFYVGTDEFVYTPNLANWVGEISYENPRLWQAYRAKYDELLTELPEVAGVMLRLGEIYTTEGYEGKDIVDRRGHRPERYRRLVDETWKIVCKKYGKTCVHRTWTTSDKEIHSNAEVYARVFNMPRMDGLVVSLKHTQSDFWHYQPLNPTLGVGRQDQIVEFQTRREYDSMGVFPASPWSDFEKAMRAMAARRNAVGYLLFPNDGGFATGVGDEPQTHYAFLRGFAAWNEANLYLACALGHDPSRPAREVLHDWTTATYGRDAADCITGILLSSQRAAQTGLYIEPYARQHVWLPLPFEWFRLVLRGYEPYKEKMDEPAAREMALQGYEAHAIAQRHLHAFRQVMATVPDRQLAAETLDSLEHEVAFYRMMRDFRETVVWFFQYHHRRDDAKAAQPYRQKFQMALERSTRSLAHYREKHNLYDADAAEKALQQMRSGKPF
jgi:hypothetical protein